MGFQPARGAAGYLRDAFFRRMFVRFYQAALPQVNQARAALGLAPLSSVFDLFARLDRALVLTSPSFDFPAATLPENVRYVGPQLDEPRSATPWQGPWEADDPRPLVVVSFSTTFQRQGNLVHRVIEALGALPVRALVTAGPALDTASFQVLPNIVVRDYVPHRQVFPHADLVITHGGHGTVMTALACGVPVLCLPMGRDQADVAARAVWRGAGSRLSSRAKPDAIRQAVRRMLDEPHFREGARRIAERMSQEGDGPLAVAELEAIA
jgi:MGT family glycosyltransferase